MELKKPKPADFRVKTATGNVRHAGRIFLFGIVYKVDVDLAKWADEDERMLLLDPIAEQQPNVEDEAGDEPAAEGTSPSQDGIVAADDESEPQAKDIEEGAGAIPPEWVEKLNEYDSLLVRQCDDWLDRISHIPFLEYLAANAVKKGSQEAAKNRIKELTPGE